MKIGILSDVHNNVENLKAALKTLDRERVRRVIFCGDLVDPAVASLFAGLEAHFVEGNVEVDPPKIARAVERLGDGCTFGQAYAATIDGKRVLAVHGHLTARLNEAIHSGLYDYVFHGHTHRRRDERIGAARVINPGALGGKRDETRSFAILDLKRDELRFIEL